MKFVPEEIVPLRCAVSEIGGFGELASPSHLAAFPACGTANLYRLGIYAEIVFPAINMFRDATAYLLTESAHRLAAVIELTARDEIRHTGATSFQFGFEQPILAVYPLGFGSHTQGYNLQVREAGNRAGTTNVSLSCYQIIGELLAYLQKLYEFCVQVAHNKIE